MTPKEKAIELVTDIQVEHDAEKRCYYFHMSLESAKRSAIIAVDEILNEYWSHNTKRRDWWKQVKHELEKL